LEEGLEARWDRHALHHRALRAGLWALRAEYLADPNHQLPMLNAVASPDGVDEAAVRKRLLEEHAIEIGAGLGEFKGRAWRIGIMGESATRGHVTGVLGALQTILSDQGAAEGTGPALDAAEAVYAS
jgi:alanine-glyoxylate transaminase/serine-glyoxylate transaminase/serine-pyruvate transaminase